MKVLLLTLLAVGLAACAAPPRAATPWQTVAQGPDAVQVVFYDQGRALPLRKGSAYDRYRVLRRSEFLRHHVPVEAVSAYVGRQGRYNYDVFYVVAEDRGRAIYGFTFGKFDIDLPAHLLYVIDPQGRVTTHKAQL